MKRRIFSLTLLLAVTLLTSCGYRFSEPADYLGSNVKTVYIAPPENRTSEVYLENYFREAFAERFSRGGRFQMVGNRADADIVLKTVIKNLSTSALSYQKQSLIAAEERATVTLDISLEKKDGQIIWRDGGFSGYEDYRVDADLNVTHLNRKNALLKLAADTAERAFDLMMSGF
ncbi:MAG: LptE family protein [Smithellaceae bacterium]|nr:LptE family protein [Smithellaceae bacterium]